MAGSVTRSVSWGELKGLRKIETVEQMTPEYRQLLQQWLADINPFLVGVRLEVPAIDYDRHM